MNIPTTQSLVSRYLSYFDTVSSEVFDKIYEWVDRDLEWVYMKMVRDAMTYKLESQKRKVVRDFVGTAGQLKRILSLEIK